MARSLHKSPSDNTRSTIVEEFEVPVLAKPRIQLDTGEEVENPRTFRD